MILKKKFPRVDKPSGRMGRLTVVLRSEVAVDGIVVEQPAGFEQQVIGVLHACGATSAW